MSKAIISLPITQKFRNLDESTSYSNHIAVLETSIHMLPSPGSKITIHDIMITTKVGNKDRHKAEMVLIDNYYIVTSIEWKATKEEVFPFITLKPVEYTADIFEHVRNILTEKGWKLEATKD